MGRNPASSNRASVVLPTGAQSEWERMTQDQRVVVPSSGVPERIAIEEDMRKHGAISTSEEEFRKQMEEHIRAKAVSSTEPKEEPIKKRKITLNDTN